METQSDTLVSCPWDGTNAEDVLLQVLCLLSIRDIISMRQVCKEFRRITGAKLLWLVVFYRDIEPNTIAFPLADYVRPLDDLSAQETELLVIHLIRRRHPSFRLKIPPSLVRVDQVRSVTWVKFVQGTWLLVATSDADTSCITVWRISDIQKASSDAVPTAEAFLSGPVRDGIVEVQDGAIVIAISLCTRTPSLKILSLRVDNEHVVFVELATHENIDHVRGLHGDWVGCAAHNSLNVPCLINWKTGTVLPFYGKPRRQGGCMAMSIDGSFVAAVFQKTIEVSRIDATFSQLHFVQSLGINDDGFIKNASICIAAVGQHRKRRPYPSWIFANIGVMSSKLTVWLIAWDGSENAFTKTFLWVHLVTPLSQTWTMYPERASDFPLVDPTGGLSWLNLPDDITVNYLRTLRTLALTTSRDERLEDIVEIRDAEAPALYFSGCFDCDHTRGVAVLGSGFGELALCDLGGLRIPQVLEGCFRTIRFPARQNETMLNSNSITSYPEYPFPLAASRLSPLNSALAPTTDEARALFDNPPLTCTVRPISPTVLRHMEGKFRDIGWLLGLSHYYGPITPLAHVSRGHEGYNYFRVGGLLVGFNILNTDLITREDFREESWPLAAWSRWEEDFAPGPSEQIRHEWEYDMEQVSERGQQLLHRDAVVATLSAKWTN
ncbi:hypothetical protein BXZ70DRAFT_923156 [Cristinia sonorae]|uniref:F-box domain-containing protein n=1 Tax=Cristinia sonorae TaxID=1940300 RepID=A0A8K0UUN5_9AGAR|nr:hypothetical protein BXZ70DRAFT_923156 [Cristinia sonorae]